MVFSTASVSWTFSSSTTWPCYARYFDDPQIQISKANQSAADDLLAATGGMTFAARSVVNPTTAIVLVASQQRRPRRSHACWEQTMLSTSYRAVTSWKGTAALSLGTALPLRGAFAAETTVVFIYIGPSDDYGYNQVHAAGAAALTKMPGIK